MKKSKFVCELCGETFEAYKKTRRFCGNLCSRRFRLENFIAAPFEEKKFSLDLSGQRFHRLLVIKRVKNPTQKTNTRSYWLVKCDCGTEKITTAANLRKFKSCGCFKKEYEKNRIGERGTNWKGGITYREGYKYIYLPDHHRSNQVGYVAEHHLVIEAHLNRKMLKDEVIHHLNGIKDDNRLENLELWSFSHPKGQRIVDKINWCVEFLKIHAPEKLTL